LMLTCRKCGGRVMCDDTYTGERAFELACILCGFRVSVHKEKNAFGRWLNGT